MRALIVSVDLGSPDYQAHAQEFEMLATGAGAELVGTLKARRQRPDAAYFIGSGKVQEGVLLAEQGQASGRARTVATPVHTFNALMVPPRAAARWYRYAGPWRITT